MTSAQNHQPLSNGNNFFLTIILFIFFISACTVSKKTTEKPVQIVKSDPVKTPTNNPGQTGVEIKKTSDKPSKPSNPNVQMDTVQWTDVTSKNAPIKIKQKKKVEYKDGLDFKDEYNIQLLIPLNSDGGSLPSDPKFVHFYAGMLRGLEVLDDEGLKLNVTVFDTEEGNVQITEKINDILTENTDLVIGPFERDDVKVFADACKSKSIPLVSPWQTSTKITNENPYYIQMKPNLKEHFLKLAQSTAQSYQKGEVAIVGKSNKETTSWINYFQESAMATVGVKDFFVPYYVNEDNLNAGSIVFDGLFKSKIKAIILPNYSYADEGFIYACLRRLAAERAGRQISVYGMPILYDSDKVDFDFYHTLNMKVVMSDFVDQDQGIIREFRRGYLDMYGEIPTSDAVKGYDLILYLGRNMWKYGRNFQNYLENEPASYLQSIYDIRKTKAEDSPISGDPSKFDYFENKHLEIIEFRGNKWLRKE
jgi:hypothetical protein